MKFKQEPLKQGQMKNDCIRILLEAQRLAYARLSAVILPRSKNACLQWHFCEAVNAAGALSAHRAKPKGLRMQDFLRLLYHTYSEK